jgi:hypothetical protein
LVLGVGGAEFLEALDEHGGFLGLGQAGGGEAEGVRGAGFVISASVVVFRYPTPISLSDRLRRD